MCLWTSCTITSLEKNNKIFCYFNNDVDEQVWCYLLSIQPHTLLLVLHAFILHFIGQSVPYAKEISHPFVLPVTDDATEREI